MYINSISSYNNSPNFQASLFRTKLIRRAFANGNDIKFMYDQERKAIDEIAKDVKVEILPTVDKSSADGRTILNVVATDENLFPPSYAVKVLPYTIQPGRLTRATQEAVEQLNSRAVLR